MINKKNIIFASTQVKKMSKFERKQQNYLYFSRRKTLRKETITFNFRIIDGHIEFPYCMLFNDLSSLKLQSRDQNRI